MLQTIQTSSTLFPTTHFTCHLPSFADTDDETMPTNPRPPHRPTYRCRRCGEAKRGHLCIFEQHANATATREMQELHEPEETVESSVQVEMDAHMTVRALVMPMA